MKTSDQSQALHPMASARGAKTLGLAVIAIAFGGFGAWAAWAPLKSAVIAPGVVKVDMNRKTVQHFEGGIVKSILVKDGDKVKAGQPLLMLTDERVSSALHVLNQQIEAEQAKLARLQAERSGASAIAFPAALTERSASDTRIAQLLITERAAFDTKRRALHEQLAMIENQISDIKQERSALRAQSDSDQSAAGLMQEELNAHEELERKNFVSKMAVLRLKRSYEEYQVRRNGRGAEIAKAQQKMSELQTRAAGLRNDYTQRAADELTLTGARLAELQERARASQDAVQRQAVLAPIAGTVVGLRVFTAGGVVRASEPLLDIVPSDAPLIVEAQLDVDDVDQVKDGMRAEVRLTALHARNTPLMEGKLVYVSADQLVSEQTKQPYYKVNIEIDEAQLSGSDVAQRLQAGMRAEVFVQTGARTALDYLLAPVTTSLRRAGKES